MKKVLLVDDNEDLTFILNEILQYHDFKVTTIHEGRKVFNIYNPDYNVVVMDIKLPDGNGIDYALKLKEKNKFVNIIMITGFMEKGIKEKCNKNGLTFFSKPFDMDIFLNKVKELTTG